MARARRLQRTALRATIPKPDCLRTARVTPPAVERQRLAGRCLTVSAVQRAPHFDTHGSRLDVRLDFDKRFHFAGFALPVLGS